MSGADLDSAVRTVVRQCMGVSAGEEVLVICNPVTEEIGALMRIEAQGDGADATLAVISEREIARGRAAAPGRRGDGAPPTWCWRRRSSRSPTPRRAKRRATPGVRIATLPGVTEEMLARLMNGDLDEMRRRGWAIVNVLNAGSEVRIT